MVIDYYNVEVEAGFLGESAAHCILYSSLAIANRDNDAGPNRKLHLVSRQTLKLGFEISANSLQMFGCDLFHFILILTPTRVYIIKLTLAGRSKVSRYSRIERLGYSPKG